MKRIKYGGTYKIEPGDFLVYQDNGKSVITERELKGRKVKGLTGFDRHYLIRLGDSVVRLDDTKKILKILEEQKMNYFVIGGNRIPMSNEIAKSLLDKAQRLYNEEQKTHKRGDCFEVGICRDTIVMLTVFDKDRNLVGATCIRGGYNGCRWTKPKIVDNYNKITKKELRSILDTNTIIPVTVKVEEIK